MEILVFKTDILNSEQVSMIEPHLNKVEGIIRWNVDLHDCDKILRVESISASAKIIEQHLQDAGYFCEELED